MKSETRAFAVNLIRAGILFWFGLEAVGLVPAPWSLDDWYWLPLGLLLLSLGAILAVAAFRERALDRMGG